MKYNVSPAPLRVNPNCDWVKDTKPAGPMTVPEGMTNLFVVGSSVKMQPEISTLLVLWLYSSMNWGTAGFSECGSISLITTLRNGLGVNPSIWPGEPPTISLMSQPLGSPSP